MSYTKVYGLKFNRQVLLEMIPEKYKRQAIRIWVKALLPYVIEMFLEDFKKYYPQHRICLFNTGWIDMPGDECVLGIRLSSYQIQNTSPGKDPNTFESLAAYRKATYGFKIRKTQHLRSSNLRKHDLVINDMKELIDTHRESRMKPAVYMVENC